MASLSEIIRESQIWKSIFRHPMPVDRRNRVVVMLTNFFLHLHPVSIKKQGIALSFTWCMGGVTFFLFLVETITGVLLMFYYRPTLEWAYADITALRELAEEAMSDSERAEYELNQKPFLAPLSHLMMGNTTEGTTSVGHVFLYVE